MKVKIGNKWIDSDDENLAVQFTDAELEHIKTMTRDKCPNLRFMPTRMSEKDALKWLREID